MTFTPSPPPLNLKAQIYVLIGEGASKGAILTVVITPVDWLLLGGLAYLIYRVHRLEKALERRSGRRAPIRMPGGGKVIPILKEHIEPGPFKSEPDPEKE